MTTTATTTTIILPIYLQKYIIKIICDYLNKQVIFDYKFRLTDNNKVIVNLSLVCWPYHKCMSNSLWSIQDFNFKPLPERFYPPKPLSNRKLYIGNETDTCTGGNKYSIYKFENIKTLRLFHREYRFHEDHLTAMYSYLNQELLGKLINLSYIYIDVEHKKGSNSVHSIRFVNELQLPNPQTTTIEIRKISLRYLSSKLVSNVKILNSLLIEQNQDDWGKQITDNLADSELFVKCIKFQANTSYSKSNLIKSLINQSTNEKLNKFLCGIPSLRIEQLPLSYILPLFQEIPSFLSIREFHFMSCFKVVPYDDESTKFKRSTNCNCSEHNISNDLYERYEPLEWESTCKVFNESLPNLQLLSIIDGSCSLGTNKNNLFNSLIFKLLVNCKTVTTLIIKGCKDLKLVIDLINHASPIQHYDIIVEKVTTSPNKGYQIDILSNQLDQINSILLNGGCNINSIKINYSENIKQGYATKMCNFIENTLLLNYNRQLLINDSNNII